MKRFERLDEATSPDGSVLTLCRHDGAYLIRVDGEELMSTRRHQSEDRLAALACEPVRDTPGATVLIGGLGLGFTLRAALRTLRPDARVVVAELVEAVIRWNRDPAYGLSVEALADPRVQVVRDDVAHVLATSPATFDAIMLDVDNGPEALTAASNDALYATAGLRTTIAALRPGGRIAWWAATDARGFVHELQRLGLAVETERVRAHVTTGPMHTLYVARVR